MFLQSKRWKLIAAFGYGVIFALAFTGAVRIGAYVFGTPLPNDTANSIFASTAAVAGTLSVLVYARSLKQRQQTNPRGQ
ncbi:MAG: hypothetical protein KF708_21560 [Pirellulales bacterium]|nr:hypothetical protein [Pirellulales bacterium]